MHYELLDSAWDRTAEGDKALVGMFPRWIGKVSLPHRPSQMVLQEYLHPEREAARRVERIE